MLQGNAKIPPTRFTDVNSVIALKRFAVFLPSCCIQHSREGIVWGLFLSFWSNIGAEAFTFQRTSPGEPPCTAMTELLPYRLDKSSIRPKSSSTIAE